MIEVIHYEKAARNKIIGYVDIKVSLGNINIFIRKIAHFQNGTKKWFSLPIFSREKIDGSIEYLKYFQFETDIYNAKLLEKLSEKVEEFCQKNVIPDRSVFNDEPLPF